MEWRCYIKCCQVIKIKGASTNYRNQMYFQNGTLLNDFPLFLSYDSKSMVWFNRKQWIIGEFSNIPTDGEIKSDQIIKCPNDKTEWTESVNGNNNNLEVTCDGKWSLGLYLYSLLFAQCFFIFKKSFIQSKV